MPIPDELAEAATALSQSAPSRVLLPAGCGKTHLLAAAATVKAHQGGRVLVLTHTHAGVDAMKRRIRAFGGVSGVAVGTLDGWMRRLVRAFPGLSAHVDTDPPDWVAIRAGALGLMSSKHVREMVGRSSDFVIVDEYQDCSLAQHAVVSVLAEEIRMPMVIAGDPLQAIYSFGDDQLIDWSADLAFAPEHDVDPVAWRWADHNEALGEQLLEVRHVLENQEDLDLRDFDQIRWIEDSPDNRRRAAWAASSKQGSVVVLERFAGMAVEVARMTKGRYGVMEEREGTRILKVAEAVDRGPGVHIAIALIELAKGCHSGLPQQLTTKRKAMETSGEFPNFTSNNSIAASLESLRSMCEAPSPAALRAAMAEVAALADYRFGREAWRCLASSADLWSNAPDEGLQRAVRAVRDQARYAGAARERCSASRSLLVKGLEYDHCVVNRAHELNRRELYVAMTRGRRSLTVLSATPVVAPAAG